MSKRITRAKIMGELVDKFSLTEFVKEDFLFGEFVLPIYDIGSHVKQWSSERSRISISANGAVAFFSVPENERWHVRKIDVYNETGGNFDIDQIFLYGSSSQIQYLFFNTAAPLANGTVTLFSFEQDIPMESAQLAVLQINIANYVGAGYISVHMLKEVETIR